MKLQQYETMLIKLSEELVCYLLKRGASREDAEDIVQDIFVKLLETELFIPPDKLRAWMYKCSMRMLIDRYRRRKRYADILKSQTITPEKWSDQFEAETAILAALHQLDEKAAQLLLMKYEQEYSVKKIAQILAISESKVKIDLFRARKKLKKILERER